MGASSFLPRSPFFLGAVLVHLGFEMVDYLLTQSSSRPGPGVYVFSFLSSGGARNPTRGGADCSTSTSLSAPSDSRRARSRRLARSRGSHRGSDDRDQPSSSLACRVAARRPPRPRAARQQGASYGRIQELVAAAFPGPDAWTVDSSIAWWAPEDQNN